jgi:hypothetical protein
MELTDLVFEIIDDTLYAQSAGQKTERDWVVVVGVLRGGIAEDDSVGKEEGGDDNATTTKRHGKVEILLAPLALALNTFLLSDSGRLSSPADFSFLRFIPDEMP